MKFSLLVVSYALLCQADGAPVSQNLLTTESLPKITLSGTLRNVKKKNGDEKEKTLKKKCKKAKRGGRSNGERRRIRENDTPWCSDTAETGGDPVFPVTLGEYHTCAVDYGAGKGLRCWGLNEDGQVGDGTDGEDVIRIVPTNVTLGDDTIRATQITLGYYHTCTIDNNDDLKCWGKNEFGQVGDGSTTIQNSPTLISLGSDMSSAKKVALGYGHTCCIDSLDNLKCWGRNNKGQLGDGSNTQLSIPTTISLGTSEFATEMALGYDHTCIIDSSQSVSCWGGNAYGQLGDGESSDRSTPALVSLGTDTFATKIAAGDFHTCVIDSLDNLQCWGRNNKGQLGDGTTKGKNTPVAISLGEDSPAPTKVALGGAHTCVIDESKMLKCWGWNKFGQLGDNTGIDQNTIPTLISLGPGDTFAMNIALGRYHSCAMDNLKNVLCWGHDIFSQLGDGTNIDSPTPKVILEVDYEDESEEST